MNLDEAIEHLKEKLNENDFICEECKNEHEQLLKWLLELKSYKKKEEEYGCYYLCYWKNEFNDDESFKDKFMTTTFIDTEEELKSKIKEIDDQFPLLEVDFYGRMIDFKEDV